MKLFLFSLVALLLTIEVNAGSQLGAEISYAHLSGYTYHIKVTTYENTSFATHPTIDVAFGDSMQGEFLLTDTQTVAPGIRMCHYDQNHTYTGQGTYIISVDGLNRVPDIVNIPNSFNIPLFISCYIVVFDDSKYCVNNSAYLSALPIFNAQIGKDYHQNIAAIDPDGDSLSYELIPCRDDGGINIPGYALPQMISINSFNGELVWKSAGMHIGLFSFAIKVNEWRRGYLVGYIVRDFPVLVESSSDTVYSFSNTNSFPVDSFGNYIDTLTTGDTLNLTFSYNDPNDTAPIMQAYSDAFSAPSPAVFTTIKSPNSVNANLKWVISSSNVRKSPYIFTFRGISPNTNTLSDLTFTSYLEGVNSDTCPLFPFLQVNNIIYNTEFLLYPNPASTLLNISANLDDAAFILITINNILGETVATFKEENTNGAFQRRINIGNLSNGVYFLKVQSKEGVMVKKFCVER